MRIALYKNEYGITSNLREFPCAEINVDEMTLNTDYTIYRTLSPVTIQGVEISGYHFSFEASGVEKFVDVPTNPTDMLMSTPFWTWNDTLSKRSWMACNEHFTAQTFENQPDDWETALYWKYYTYTSDDKWEQYKNPTSTTFNSANTYYVCDSEEYEPQKVYYANCDYATSFTIGQCIGGTNQTWFGYGSGALMNGYMCGFGLGSTSNTTRGRLVAVKGANEAYTGYDGMHSASYAQGYEPIKCNSLNQWVLTGDPVHEIHFNYSWILAHIIYNNKEYIGWGTIRYDLEDPTEPIYGDFTCVNIELFRDAIVPDKEPYSNGSTPGNAGGTGGTGPGLPDGDVIEPTRVAGGLAPLGYGLHAYQVTASDIGVLNSFLWGRSGNAFDPGGMWNKFLNYKFNPVAGIVSLHHIPYDLLCTPGSSVNVMMAGITLDGVSTGGVTVSGLGITDTDHIGHLRIPSSGYFEIEEPYIGFQDFARTKVHLYLPFCGVVELDPAKCIGGGLVVDYQCDNLNGNVCAQVKVVTPPNQKGTRRQFVAAVASGNAAYHIPVTGNDNGTGEILGSLKQAAVGMITGSVGSVAGAALDLGLDAAKRTTTVSGSLAGNVGYLGSLDVILEITYGDYYSTDGEYPATVGRPSYVQGAVKEFSGFCQFKAHTESIAGATDTEKQEIARILEQGIIVNVT